MHHGMPRFAITMAIGMGAALLAGCAASGPLRPQPFPVPGPTGPAADLPPEADRGAAGIVETALRLRGIPYRSGGDDPNGFDCSGFTRYVFAQHGVALPRVAADQFDAGAAVRTNELHPGDLVFFTTTAPGPSHVGVAIGDGRFVHAPNARSTVRVDRLGAGYWSRRYLGARRVLD